MMIPKVINEAEKKVYEDTLPEDLPTLEDVRQKYGKVVWCQYIACKYNEEIKGLQKTSGSILCCLISGSAITKFNGLFIIYYILFL